jgi:sugar phosphate isomerase/epimerase
MMDIACHTWAFNDLTLPEALGTIARLGFRAVDIGSGPSLNTARAAANPRREAADLRADLDAYHLKLTDLYLMLPRISLADEARRAKDIDLFRALVPFAAALGAPGITVSPGLAHAAEDVEAFERSADALRQMVEAGKAAGLRLSIEPHLDSMAATPVAALRFIEAVPGLEITLDWAHMLCQNIARDAILSLLPYTRHVQVRQAAPNKLQTPFEAGKLDIQQAVADLRAAGYAGALCVELMNMPGWHGMIAVDAIRESARLRDALRDARDRVKTQ